ncbi:MAG TPA: hypothetical protein VF759_03825 [Allosphingosinicella sp.]
MHASEKGSGRASQHPRITPAGIVIEGTPTDPFTLKPGRRPNGEERDSIDLSFLAGIDGGPLPPLVLRHCIINVPLRLTESHFAFVWIENCSIHKIDADHCQIDNHCRFINLSPAAAAGRPAICQIRMVGARIGGTADFRGCNLSGPRFWPEATSRGHADRYALSLASARVEGRLLLDHQFTAHGGVSLYQASVSNSLSMNTARIESRYFRVPALDMEEARIGGSFTWRNAGPDRGALEEESWHVAGRMVLRRASIAGDVILEHCRWAAAGARSLAAPGDEEPDSPAVLVDHVNGGIDARACEIGGQLRIGVGCLVGRWTTPPTRRAAEDVCCGVFGASVDGWKASFARGVRIEDGARFLGPVLLNDSNIGHGLIMRGAVDLPDVQATTEKVPEAFDVGDARIEGLVRFWCSLDGSLSLRRAKIDGTVELQRIDFRRPNLTSGDPDMDCKQGTATVLDLGSATVTGTLYLGAIAWKPETEIVERRPALAEDLSGTSSLMEYPSKFGVDCLLRDRVLVSLTSDCRALLTGSADQFRRLYSPAGPLPDGAAAVGYLQRYFDHVTDDLGPKSLAKWGEPEAAEGGWRLRDCEYSFSGGWQVADIHIDSELRVTRSNERLIARPPPAGAGDFFQAGAFRLLRTRRASPGHRPPFLRADLIRETVARHLRGQVQRSSIFDLRGLTCHGFDDDEALVWSGLEEQGGWRLLLDGMDFQQLEAIDPKERTKGGRDSGSAVQLTGDSRPGRVRRTAMLHAFLPGHIETAEKRRVTKWRGLLPLARDGAFSPQPFETFARAYLRSGDSRSADRIISAQKRLEWLRIFDGSLARTLANRRMLIVTSGGWAFIFCALFLWAVRPLASWDVDIVSAMRISMLVFVALWLMLYAAVRSWPYMLLTAGMLFDLMFRFGLKPARAVQTSVICLALGVFGTIALRDKILPVQQYHSVHIARESDRSEDSMAQWERIRLPTDAEAEGCNVVIGSAMDRALYAFDVFVPLLDVRQECAFTIERTAYFVRALKTLYAALGWVVVSLTLLTISGVLRRYLEK